MTTTPITELRELEWVAHVEDVRSESYGTVDSDYRVHTRLTMFRPERHGHPVENCGYRVEAVVANCYGDYGLVVHVSQR